MAVLVKGQNAGLLPVCLSALMEGFKGLGCVLLSGPAPSTVPSGGAIPLHLQSYTRCSTMMKRWPSVKSEYRSRWMLNYINGFRSTHPKARVVYLPSSASLWTSYEQIVRGQHVLTGGRNGRRKTAR